MAAPARSMKDHVGRGVVSGLAGTVVMTAFQELVEMPLAAARGLRGARALSAVFGTVYAGDVALNTALGLYKPWTWSVKDWVVDLVDKLVQAAVTGVVLDRIADPAP